MLTKIQIDREKVKSLLIMAENTEKTIIHLINELGYEGSSNMIAREYYEVIRELATGILILDGLKATGENAHKETIDNLINHNEFEQGEIYELHDLRIRRNKSSYEGKPIEPIYIKNKKDKLDILIKKLKDLLKKRLKKR